MEKPAAAEGPAAPRRPTTMNRIITGTARCSTEAPAASMP
jgi:hypothetical protein